MNVILYWLGSGFELGAIISGAFSDAVTVNMASFPTLIAYTTR